MDHRLRDIPQGPWTPMQHGPPHGPPHGGPQHGSMTSQQHGVVPQHGPPPPSQHVQQGGLPAGPPMGHGPPPHGGPPHGGPPHGIPQQQLVSQGGPHHI
ncbi:hypothetical protein EVAR_101371_1 [Eumeta japonica]|uniref:Uncharacterized protein n=1 Tax=Eumeta variegata TaxID=151549 RepID=A0A4C1TT37_EUMVA|nr:hypothetical protein EVAR_101371_1 [Eumeta japonica]